MIPQKLIESLSKLPHFNEKLFIEAHQQQSQTSIRVNSLKTNNFFDVLNIFCEKDIQLSEVEWCSNSYYLSERPFFTHDPLIHAGAYYVQEASSMFLWHILNFIQIDSNKIVLDLCAAPGGKSTLLNTFFSDGLLVSNEVIKTRNNILIENLTKWGTCNTVVTNNDSKHFSKLNSFFDLVMVDAPCSGSGLFRKDKNSINEWSEDNVKLCSERQRRILSDIFSSIKKDGYLIYSTCSFSVEENEDIVDWALSNFNIECVKINVDESWGITETNGKSKNSFCYRFYPYKTNGEGFFICVFRVVNYKSNTSKLSLPKLQLANNYEIEKILNYVEKDTDFLYFKHFEVLKFISKKWMSEILQLMSCLYIKKMGTEVGEIKGKSLVPSHEMAMSIYASKKILKIELNKWQALQYLSKNEVIIDTPFEGWGLVHYKNYNLGWIKALKNRFNNYYPTDWRILNTNFTDEKN